MGKTVLRLYLDSSTHSLVLMSQKRSRRSGSQLSFNSLQFSSTQPTHIFCTIVACTRSFQRSLHRDIAYGQVEQTEVRVAKYPKVTALVLMVSVSVKKP